MKSKFLIVTLTAFLSASTVFAEGGAHGGGGGSAQAKKYFQENVDSHNYNFFDADLAGKKVRADGTPEEISGEQQCRAFEKAAVEGFGLLGMLLNQVGYQQADHEEFFPKLRIATEPNRVIYQSNGQQMSFTQKRFQEIADAATSFCHNPRYTFNGNKKLNAKDGKPLMAYNHVDNGQFVIDFNPPEWSSKQILKHFPCPYSDTKKWVQNTRRMIAVHEILSLELNHTLEKDESYPFTSEMMLFARRCNEMTYGMREILLSAPGSRAHLRYDHDLHAYVPNGYRPGTDDNRGVASEEISVADREIQGALLLKNVLQCDQNSDIDFDGKIADANSFIRFWGAFMR